MDYINALDPFVKLLITGGMIAAIIFLLFVRRRR